MLFSSTFFIFLFLPLLLIIYYAIPKKYFPAKNAALLIFSLIFYSWGEPVYVLLMIYTSFFNYFMAHIIVRAKIRGGRGRLDFVFTIFVNLSILCFFKYFGFLMDTVNGIFGSNISYTALPLPVGISFYTFQALSYVIDVYKSEVRPQKSFLNFALYISLFPQLIAGPIINYKDIEQQLSERTTTLDRFGQGARRFIFGLAKKVILANNLGVLHRFVIGLSASESSVMTSWIGIMAYTLQLYFDFSGYSDMAIGLGRMFGFKFKENFNYPYISESVTEFWRRWHISLSSWFREYLYIPLGGNRVSVSRHIVNLLIVWALTGLWHGASWNFVVWGLYYGILLILEKYLYGEYLQGLKPVIRHVYTGLVVIVGWVFFSSKDLPTALDYIKQLSGVSGIDFLNMTTIYLLRTNLILLLLACLIAARKGMDAFKTVAGKYPLAEIVFLTGIFTVAAGYLIYDSYNPFLYFRF